MGWDTDKVNVNGGAIAIGHPIGASGARVLVTLLHEMQRRDAKKGLATLCIGGGRACATNRPDRAIIVTSWRRRPDREPSTPTLIGRMAPTPPARRRGPNRTRLNRTGQGGTTWHA
jgi:hypothetical protein